MVVAGDRVALGHYGRLTDGYNRATRDHLAPLPFGGPNTLPPRPLRPGCAGSSWSAVVPRTGIVEEVTVGRPADVTLASVRADLGPVLMTRWPGGDLPAGTLVELSVGPSGRITRSRPRRVSG